MSMRDLAAAVKNFNERLSKIRPTIAKSLFQLLAAAPSKWNGQDQLPREAWWDTCDEMLMSLANGSFQGIVDEKIEDAPKALGGAVARYEPVLRKVPHYFFPSLHVWNSQIMADGTYHAYSHFRNLQEDAISKLLFSKMPSTPQPKDGLVALLEWMAKTAYSGHDWELPEDSGAAAIDGALVVCDLKKCTYVSEKGREGYREGRGCILIPFVADDGRLVGHGLVVFDGELELTRESTKAVVASWRLLFAATFAPLISNLNAAVISVLDGPFLGRIRELRLAMADAAPRLPVKEQPSPTAHMDYPVLNKITIYEMLESRKEEKIRVVFFDLDGFKNVNKEVGHQAADVLLCHVVAQLNQHVFKPREGRWLGRFGGDEFVGIVDGEDDPVIISKSIADAISVARTNFNIEEKQANRPTIESVLTTSLGWVSNADLAELESAEGLDANRKALFRLMRHSYVLICLADEDTQELVKDLGKNGALQFEKRRHLNSSKDEILKYAKEWLNAITWLPPYGMKRTIRAEFTHTPPA